MIKKSLPIFSNSTTTNVDEANGIIKGIVILQSGEDKVGDYFDSKSLEQLVSLGNAQGQGVKSRNGHPNMCDSSLGTYIGRYKNFSVSSNGDGLPVVTADLHLDKEACTKSPQGNVYDYILSMAKSNSDMFGNSIVYNPTDVEVVNDIPYTRFNSFIASDLVDSPAASTSLFKSDTDFAAIATEFLDENPELFEALSKNDSIVNEFLGKYKNYKKQKNKINMKIETKSFKEKVKSFLGLLEEQKDFNMTAMDGSVITITDPDGDGVPMVGDTVTDASGSPVASATVATEDGSTITTDASGVITDVTAAMASPAVVEPTPAEKSMNELKEKYEALVAEHTSDKEEATKAIETLSDKVKELTENAKKIKSTYVPETSGTQFKPVEKTTLTIEERKEAIKKTNSKNK